MASMGTGACVVINYDDCMAENRTVLEANQCKSHIAYNVLIVATDSEWVWWKLERHAIDRQQCFATEKQKTTWRVCVVNTKICRSHATRAKRARLTFQAPKGREQQQLRPSAAGYQS